MFKWMIAQFKKLAKIIFNFEKSKESSSNFAFSDHLNEDPKDLDHSNANNKETATSNFSDNFEEVKNLHEQALEERDDSVKAARSLLSGENIMGYLKYQDIGNILFHNCDKFDPGEIEPLLAKHNLTIWTLASFDSSIAQKVLDSQLCDSLTTVESAQLCCKHIKDPKFKKFLSEKQILSKILDRAASDLDNNILTQIREIFSKDRSISQLVNALYAKIDLPNPLNQNNSLANVKMEETAKTSPLKSEKVLPSQKQSQYPQR